MLIINNIFKKFLIFLILIFFLQSILINYVISKTNKNFDCYPDGPEMVYIKGGVFIFSVVAERRNQISKNGIKGIKVELDDYYISRKEISFKDFRKFCITKSDYYYKLKYREIIFMTEEKNVNENEPFSPVLWGAAIHYCNWLSETTGADPFFGPGLIYLTICR